MSTGELFRYLGGENGAKVHDPHGSVRALVTLALQFWRHGTRYFYHSDLQALVHMRRSKAGVHIDIYYPVPATSTPYPKPPKEQRHGHIVVAAGAIQYWRKPGGELLVNNPQPPAHP